MKKKFLLAKALLLAGFTVTSLFVSASAVDDICLLKNLPSDRVSQDTTPSHKKSDSKNEYNSADFEKTMQELNKQMEKMSEEMKKVNFEKINSEIKAAMAKVDWQKIKMETEEAVKKVDWQKIKAEVDNAMKDAEISMKNIDKEKIHKNIELMQEKLKKQSLDMQLNGEKMQKKLEESMSKAKEGMEKLKVEMQNMKEFTEALEKDGLINKKKGYKIRVDNGELFINGTKQPKETYEKYKQYYRKDKFTINSDGDSISSI